MLNINRVMITGRLTRDPETKYLPSGMALTNLGVAVSRPFKDKSGEWREDTCFIDVETWGKLAERCAETLKKGRPVFVEGRLKQDTWERDGVKQSKIRITADMVRGFDVPSRGEGGGAANFDEGDYDGGESGMGGGGGGSSRASSGGRSNYSSGGSGGGRMADSGRSNFKPTGAPSDNLDFQGSNVQDDIPF